MNRHGPEAFDGLRKEPFGTQGIGETWQEQPAAVNWGGSVVVPQGDAWVEVLDFRYPGEPRSWALTFASRLGTAQFYVTHGSGGGIVQSAAVNVGGYLTHGQSIKVFARNQNAADRCTAIVSHGTGGVPNI